MRNLRTNSIPLTSVAAARRSLADALLLRTAIGALGVSVALLGSGCRTGRPDYDSLPPQTLSPFPSPGTAVEDPLGDSLGLPTTEEVVSNLDLAPEPEEPETETSRRLADRAANDDSLIVIGEDEQEEEEGDLWERVRAASEKERSRRDATAQPVVVITNKNLAEMAEGGRVTFTKPAPGSEDKAPGTASGSDSLDPLAEMHEQEIYWRERARDIRIRLKTSWDEVQMLEDEAAELRTRFYREDDPFTRDGKIKPAWDHTLERLDVARTRVDETQLELERFMEEGRRAGALPGWLREGSELIPPLEPQDEEVREADVGEPRVVDSPP